jgi:hypothetical protein
MAMSLLSLSAFAETYSAYISDAKCAAKHAADMNGKCVQGCVKGGQAPVAVVGDKVYKLDDNAKVMDHLGHKVTITGKLEGDTIKVESVAMAE